MVRLQRGNLQHVDNVIAVWCWTLHLPHGVLPRRWRHVAIATARRQPLPAHCARALHDILDFRWRHLGGTDKSKCRTDVSADGTRWRCSRHYVISTICNTTTRHTRIHPATLKSESQIPVERHHSPLGLHCHVRGSNVSMLPQKKTQSYIRLFISQETGSQETNKTQIHSKREQRNIGRCDMFIHTANDLHEHRTVPVV